jgi:hypothetical protein
MRHTLLLPLFCLSFCAAPTGASATTVIPLTLDRMAGSSDVIVHGEVLRSQVIAVAKNERHLQTVVTVRVDRLLKGPKGTRELTLRLPGGKLGKWAMQIPGMPSFKAGEEVVLFLEKTRVSWALTGLSQGKFTVYRDPKDGTKRVRRLLGGVHFVGFDPKGQFSPKPRPRDRTGQSAASLIAEIEGMLRKAAPKTAR